MSEKRVNRRFNVLDIAIILLVLLALIGVWQRSNLQKLFTVDEMLEEYTVTFEIRKIRSTTIEGLDPGSELYLVQEEGERIYLGTLSQQLSVSAAIEYLPDKDGNSVPAVYPQDSHEYFLDADGVLRCEGIEHDGSFLLGGQVYLAINQRVSVQTEIADFEIRITGIEKAS